MADTDWNLHSKQLVTPTDDDRMLIEPSDETAKAVEVGGFREWLMNTALFNTLTTTAKTILGAIEEIKGKVDSNTASLNDLTNKMQDVLLFEGEVYEANTVINLAEPLSNFQEIIFDVGFNGYEGRTFRTDKLSFELKGLNLANTGASKIISVYEVSITKTSDSVLTIARNFEWVWADNAQTNYGSPTLNNVGTTTRIIRIYGRK